MNTTSVDLRNHVAPGTNLQLFLGWTLFWILMPLLVLLTLLLTYGIALIAWIWWLIHYTGNLKRAYAQLRGSALHISQTQMPEYYEIAHEYAKRLGLKECPEIYLIEDNQQNALAKKFGAKNAIVLFDDIVFGAIKTGNIQALNFIIAHELAHHALGHTGFFRSLLTSRYKNLSRLDEFSCDSVAHALVDNLDAAKDAFCLLLVGPQLFATVSRTALDDQSLEVATNKHSKKSEKLLTHPLLLRRYAHLVHHTGV